MSLVLSIPVLGLERVCPRRAVLGLGLGFFCVFGLGLEPCVLDQTSDKNVTCGPETAMLRTKNLNFFLVIRLNWLAKIESRGPRPPDCQILVNYNFTHVLLMYAKMLIETETDLWWHFNWGGAGPPTPSGYAYGNSVMNIAQAV